MGKCGKITQRARRYGCYLRSGAGKLKTGVERIGSFSGEQGKKHKLGFGLFFLAIIGISAMFGAAYLAQSVTPGNPTCLSTTQSLNIAWKDSGGNVLANPAKEVSGTITCTISGTMALVEYANVPVWYGTNTGPPSANVYMATPYYIDSIQIQVYQGSSLVSVVDAVPSTANYPQNDKDWIIPRSGGAVSPAWFGQIGSWYSTKRTAFPAGYSPNMVADPNTGLYWNDNPPIPTATWAVSLDTRTLTNGVSYSLWAKVHWNYWDSLSLWAVFRAIVPHPPSIVNYGQSGGWTADDGGSMFLSSLTIGEPEAPIIGPSRITDLACTAVTNGETALTWTVPKDDTSELVGYVLKYSTLGPITAGNWNNANWSAIYDQTWVPVTQGSIENLVVTKLESGVNYWFAVVAYDAAGYYGAVSNSPCTAPSAPVLPLLFIVMVGITVIVLIIIRRK